MSDRIDFTPNDSLFFRDGSPFNRGELASNMRSIFPPSPMTMSGAVRAAWARAAGWDGRGGGASNWSSEFGLGTGENLPSGLSFNGPYLRYQGELCYPLPHHLMGLVYEDSEQLPADALTTLVPSETILSDLGLCALPMPQDALDQKRAGSYQPLRHWWIRHSDLCELIHHARLPTLGKLIAEETLWCGENRVGNDLQPVHKTTDLNALFETQHIRLTEQSTLCMYAEGLPSIDLCKVEQQLQPTGGEGRSSSFSVVERQALSFSLGPADNPTMQKRCAVLVLTPLMLTDLTELSGMKVLCACTDRAQMFGGWDRSKPRSLQPCIPTGGVLYVELEHGQRLGTILKLGKLTQWGFGTVVLAHFGSQKE